MIKFKKTLKKLKGVGKMLKVGLQKELIAQRHNATGRLSRGLRSEVKGTTLNIISSVSYWKAVNNPKFAKTPNYNAIASWARAKKGIEATSAAITRIYAKMLRKGYGKPYVFWTEGNSLRRTNFAGYVAKKFKGKVAKELAPSIGKDVASMIREKIKNNTKAKVR
jgi:hypothetical protein